MNDRWSVKDERDGSGGTYFTLTQRTTGTMEAGVTVKWTKHNTTACLTCLSTTCPHARWLASYLKARAA